MIPDLVPLAVSPVKNTKATPNRFIMHVLSTASAWKGNDRACVFSHDPISYRSRLFTVSRPICRESANRQTVSTCPLFARRAGSSRASTNNLCDL